MQSANGQLLPGEGLAKFCLDLTAPVFLRVETESRTYWFTAQTPEQTKQIAAWLNTGH